MRAKHADKMRYFQSLPMWQRYKWSVQARENMLRWILFGKAERRNLD